MTMFEAQKDGGTVSINLEQIAYILVPGKGMGTVGSRATGTIHFNTGLALTLSLDEIAKIQEFQKTLTFIKDVTKS